MKIVMDSAQTTTPSPHNSGSNIKWILFSVVLLFIGTGLGVIIVQSKLLPLSSPAPKESLNQTIQDSIMIKASPLFKAQTATIQGQITKRSNSTVTVSDNQNQTSDFPLSPKLVIYKQLANSSRAVATTDANQLDLNKDALIVLQVINGEYTVSSVSYTASSSATTSPGTTSQ